MYQTLIYLFFSQLAVGGMLSVLMVPHSAGRSFFRFCGVLSFFLLASALATGPYPFSIVTSFTLGRPLALLLLVLSSVAALAFVCAVVTERLSLQKPLLSVAVGFGSVGLFLDGYHSLDPVVPAWAHWLTAAYFLLSAFFLGSVVFSMILGHWYLVVPTLPIRPLRLLTMIMMGSVICKILLACLTLIVFWTWGNLGQKETLSAFTGIGGVFLWARVLFGFLGPLVVAFMTWETVKINSTQSATGLLYVATVFALIGEIFSKHIFYTTSIPI